jgi:hypothetical protein
MPVHVRVDRAGLRLTLSNGAEVLDDQLAGTPREAKRVAIMMLSSREELNHGDTLTVRHDDDGTPPLVPSSETQ